MVSRTRKVYVSWWCDIVLKRLYGISFLKSLPSGFHFYSIGLVPINLTLANEIGSNEALFYQLMNDPVSY